MVGDILSVFKGIIDINGFIALSRTLPKVNQGVYTLPEAFECGTIVLPCGDRLEV